MTPKALPELLNEGVDCPELQIIGESMWRGSIRPTLQMFVLFRATRQQVRWLPTNLILMRVCPSFKAAFMACETSL